MAQYDVIVIGAGNAALAASVSARGAGAERVLVLEKAPEHDRGGNTHFSGGLFRFAFNRPDDLLRLVPKAREVAGFMEGIEAYPADAFREDLDARDRRAHRPGALANPDREFLRDGVLDGRAGDRLRARPVAERRARRQRDQMAQGRDRARRA